MKFTLKVWRQKNTASPGKLVAYKLGNIDADMSFLEMFDLLSGELIQKGEEQIAFDHDCREEIN